MYQLLRRISSLFYPDDEELSPIEKSQIQLYRLLALLGAVLIPAFGFLYTAYTPLAVDPVWARLGVAGLCAVFLGASYVSPWIRRTYMQWGRGLIYVATTWTILLTFSNHLAGNYVASLLLTYATMIVVVGIGAQSIRPVLSFAGFGLVLTAGLSPLSVAPYTSPSVLLASMGTVALVEGIAVYSYFSTRALLRGRESRLRGLANSIPGVVFQFVVRPDGSYRSTFVSDNAESLLGISPDVDGFVERFIGHVPDPHRDRLIESIDRAVEREERWRFEVPIDRPDGEPLWVLGTTTPERREGTLVFNSMLFDITQRREAEEAVLDREEKIEGLYTSAQDLLSARSAEEVAARLEKMVRTTFGYPLTGIHFAHEGRLVPVQVSPDVSERVPEVPFPSPDLDDDSIGAQVYHSGETIVTDDLRERDEFDYDVLRAGACVPIGEHGVVSVASMEVGGIEPFDVHLVEILAAYAGVVLDRLDRENAQVAAKEEAEKASQLKTAMLENMSHEFRTPLTSIVGFAEALKDDLSGKQGEAAEKIFRGGRRLLDTLDSILQLSSLEAGVTDLPREQVCLDEVAERALETCQPDAKEASLTVTTEYAHTPVEGYWNEAAVSSITKHLLENAIKFTPEGGDIAVRVKDEGPVAVLEVEDTGVGMPTEQVPTLFEPFEQESNGQGRRYEGSGIGLSLVERLVEIMGGSISVETKKGAGSRFTVQLPREKVGERV